MFNIFSEKFLFIYSLIMLFSVGKSVLIFSRNTLKDAALNKGQNTSKKQKSPFTMDFPYLKISLLNPPNST